MSNYRKERYIREGFQNKLAKYLRQQTKIGTVNRINEIARKQGENHYNVGHSLEEAEVELRNDPGFVYGYEYAKRQTEANDYMYNLGFEYFEKGITAEKFPPNYANNIFFLRGYNEALRLSMKDNTKHR